MRLRKGRKSFKITFVVIIIDDVMVENFKTMQVSKEVWDRLARLKAWPERCIFSDVIKFLLDEYEEKTHTKELLK